MHLPSEDVILRKFTPESILLKDPYTEFAATRLIFLSLHQSLSDLIKTLLKVLFIIERVVVEKTCFAESNY